MRQSVLAIVRGGSLVEELLSITEIDKSFPGVHALKKVSLSVRKGEVLALVGENGAGKSTLMNILSGIHQKDSGSIRLEGREMKVARPLDSQLLGISIIHQELNLVPHFSVAENIFVGREKRRAGLLFDRKRTHEEAKALLARVGLEVDPRALVMNLSIAQRQMIEVAKALAFNARIIVMDEPTSSLSDGEVGRLMGIIRELKAGGVSVIFISHKLDEVLAIADRITVLRDGEVVGTREARDCSEDSLIKMMVGREITEIFPKGGSSLGDLILEVRGFSRGKRFHDISFSLRRGEILGLAGLVGAGRSEVLQAVFGIDPFDAGEVFVDGRKVAIRSPQQAIGLGMGFVPEDRKLKGLLLNMAVRDNVSLASLGQVSSWGILSAPRERALAQAFIDRLKIKTADSGQKALHLSGGNQQKVVISKWLAIKPRILFVDEPTRGVDVGAKKEIYDLLGQLTREGVSIVMVSSELPEILGMCDRIIVMHEGKMKGELLRGDATQHLILSMALSKESA
jgi:ABC-type sugar transport system ATPase subunit